METQRGRGQQQQRSQQALVPTLPLHWPFVLERRRREDEGPVAVVVASLLVPRHGDTSRPGLETKQPTTARWAARPPAMTCLRPPGVRKGLE